MRVIRREDLRFLFLETLMVLIGVFAALFLDGAREEARTARAVEAATMRLVREVRQNQQELESLSEVVSTRVVLLRQQRDALEPGIALSGAVGGFGGFRTADFSDAAWARLSRSQLGESADPDLLRDAFFLYEWNAQFEGLNEEINDLVFSELFFSPGKVAVALDISERIMDQQLAWAAGLLARYEEFLAAYSGG